MGTRKRYVEHLDREEIDYQLNKFGRIVWRKNKFVCPYCGLIIEPDFETEQKEVYHEERVCPECARTFLLSSVKRSDMDYEFLWNKLKECIREHLCALTNVKDVNTFYPEDDGAIEMTEKTIAFIEDAERNRESSGRNYEKLWHLLWDFLSANSAHNLILSMLNVNNNEARLHLAGARSMTIRIREQMKTMEKEMTTAGQGDGQSAQD